MIDFHAFLAATLAVCSVLRKLPYIEVTIRIGTPRR